MAKKTYNHTHKLERTNLGKNGYIVYKCLEPDCTYFISSDLVKGKVTKCHAIGCENEFQLTQLHLTRETKRPICESCIELKRQGKESRNQLLILGKEKEHPSDFEADEEIAEKFLEKLKI